MTIEEMGTLITRDLDLNNGEAQDLMDGILRTCTLAGEQFLMLIYYALYTTFSFFVPKC